MRGRHPAAVATGLGGGLAAGAWLALRRPAVQRVDVRVGEAVRLSGSPGMDRAVICTTDLGSMYAVVGMAAALAASGRLSLAADVFGVGSLAWVTAQGGKTRVRRQRPYEADGVRRLVAPPTGSSFPSGHAAVAVAVMTVVAEQARPRAAPLLRALGVYTALSRVYVGVHYPTDVIGGAGLGLALAGLWRGRLAALGRWGVAVCLATGRRAAPPLGRLGLWAAVGLRRGGRGPRRSRPPRRSPGAPARGLGDPTDPTRPPATSPPSPRSG